MAGHVFDILPGTYMAHVETLIITCALHFSLLNWCDVMHTNLYLLCTVH